MSETPEQEAARVRAEVAAELNAEESGTPPVVDATDGEPKKEEEKIVDPWEGVNPALKQAFDVMSSRVETLTATETRLKQAESRIGAITNELHAAKKAAEVVKEAPTAAQMAAAAVSDEKWESLKKDFPEWAEAFDGRFDQKLTVKLKELRDELKEEIKSVVPGTTTENLDLRLLSIVKPKWKETVASPEWKEWLAIQNAETAALITSDKAEDAISILTAFEEAKRGSKTATEIAAERNQRLRTAVLPVGGKATPAKSEAEMTAEELRANIGKEIFAET
jgi:nitrogen regulatory protein PII-like uncharacterized protein